MANPNRNHPDPTAGPARLLHQEVWSRGDLALVEEHHDHAIFMQLDLRVEVEAPPADTARRQH